MPALASRSACDDVDLRGRCSLCCTGSTFEYVACTQSLAPASVNQAEEENITSHPRLRRLKLCVSKQACLLDILDTDVLQRIVLLVSPDDDFAVSLSCKELHQVRLLVRPRLRTRVCSTLRSMSLQQWASAMGCPSPYPHWAMLEDRCHSGDSPQHPVLVLGPPEDDGTQSICQDASLAMRSSAHLQAGPATVERRACAGDLRLIDEEISCIAILLLEPMLPRQRLSLSEADLTVLASAASCDLRIGVVGVNGKRLLARGVSVTIEAGDLEHGERGDEAGTGPTSTLVGGRVFEVLEVLNENLRRNEAEQSRVLGLKQQWFRARVRWLSVDTGEESSGSGFSLLYPAAGPALASEPLLRAARGLAPKVKLWTSLVRYTGRERLPNQLDGVLADLGPMPSSSDPLSRALWVAALINSSPSFGGALEVRPAVLALLRNVEAELKVIKEVLDHSIAYMITRAWH